MPLPTYLSSADADALAAQLPGLAAYKALPDAAARLAALVAASARIDAAYRWQGRKYDAAQELEFPRVPYAAPSSVVWDWDAGTDAAIVPTKIKLAVLYEADAMSDGFADRIAKNIAAGLTGQATGGVSEQYRAGFAGEAGVTPICPDAARIMSRYALRTGMIL